MLWDMSDLGGGMHGLGVGEGSASAAPTRAQDKWHRRVGGLAGGVGLAASKIAAAGRRP